jgi:two-component system, OmpR family, response regulator
MPDILIVDDDAMMTLMLQRFLAEEGFVTHIAANITEARRQLKQQIIDIVLLDLSLRGEDGLVLARDLAASPKPGVIIISGKGEAIDKIIGLEVGADDYIGKPFNLRELLARIRALLRRLETIATTRTPTTIQSYCVQDWQLNCMKYRIEMTDGHHISLTTAEYKLLYALVSHPHQVLNRDQLMDYVAGRDWTPFDRAIDTQVRRLRQKLKSFGLTNDLIRTVRGTGYMFTANTKGI